MPHVPHFDRGRESWYSHAKKDVAMQKLDPNGHAIIDPRDGQPETITSPEDIIALAEAGSHWMRQSARAELGYALDPQSPDILALVEHSRALRDRRVYDRDRKRAHRARRRRKFR